MLRLILKWLWPLSLTFSLLACAGGAPGDTGLTPTPPVPVFGDFLLGVAVSTPAGTSGLRAMSAATMPKALTVSGGIVVDETRNTVSDISFEGNSSGSRIDFPGVYIVELIQQQAVVNLEFPDFGASRIPFDTYNRFRMKLLKLQSQDIPAQLLPDPLVSQLLLDRSVVVTGSFPEAPGKDVNGDGNIGRVPFQVLSDNEVELEVSSPNFFTVSPDKVNFFFIAFQVEAWFNGLLPKLQDLTPSDLSGGVAVISHDISNDAISNILNAFESNVEGGCKSAPSGDSSFEQGDVDGDSSSGPL